MPFVALSLPGSTSNNQALFLYSDSTYTLAKAVEYLSFGIAAASLLLFVVGYFGSKLQSLEANAVVQLAALLIVTVENTGPTFEALTNLKLSLGVTPLFEGQFAYEDSVTPTHFTPLFTKDDSISAINIFWALFLVPLFLGAIFKLLAVTVFSENWQFGRMWKYSFGTFAYYGLLFLAYGITAAMTLSLRHFRSDLSCGIGVIVGVLFLGCLIVWTAASAKYHNEFGSFKRKFFKFQLSQYHYAFIAAERVLTAVLVVSLSPGFWAAGTAAVVFSVEAVFLLVTKPYILGQWKRPFFNKVLSVVICTLFIGASVTSVDSTLNQMIPLAVLLILLAVLVVAVIGSFQ